MIYFERELEKIVPTLLTSGKVVLVVGARRVGKTVLLQRLLESRKDKALILNGEDIETEQVLQERSVAHYRRLVGTKSIVVIDEAQNIPEIGAIAKLMIDHITDLCMILTGRLPSRM